MNDKDSRILEEAYNKINEGIDPTEMQLRKDLIRVAKYISKKIQSMSEPSYDSSVYGTAYDLADELHDLINEITPE